jgi:hypothetical protein
MGEAHRRGTKIWLKALKGRNQYLMTKGEFVWN